MDSEIKKTSVGVPEEMQRVKNTEKRIGRREFGIAVVRTIAGMISVTVY